MEPLLTMREVAGMLAVSRATAYRLTAEGELPFVRISGSIRVRKTDFDAFLLRVRS
ncbi:helix-turn-helix domain-containing protein [Anaeromyxobacter sp. Red801]|uniref:helix-turn-helix domain-containing protein n=1 Tax=Anaeromyxobacter sp. Red801 TaxID=3411632 RepID=UPI003BA3BAF1